MARRKKVVEAEPVAEPLVETEPVAEAEPVAEPPVAEPVAELLLVVDPEVEMKRQLEELEQARLAEEAEAEAKRLAEEAETKRLAEEAEAKRLADEAEAQRVAKLEDEKRVAYRCWHHIMTCPNITPTVQQRLLLLDPEAVAYGKQIIEQELAEVAKEREQALALGIDMPTAKEIVERLA